MISFRHNISFSSNKPSKLSPVNMEAMPDAKNSVDSFEKEKKYTKKEKLTLGAIITALGTLLASLLQIFKRKPDSAKNILKLIKRLQPQDKELAKEFYPILLKYSESLNINPEHFNHIMSGVTNENKKFMVTEGIGLISKGFKNIKEFITNPQDDILAFVKTLNVKNKNTFEKVTDAPQMFKISDVDDILLYLNKFNPKDKSFAFDELLPLLNRHEADLKLKTAERYVDLLNHISPKTKESVELLAEAKNLNCKHVGKFDILLNVNESNNNCLVPLLEKSEIFQNKSDVILKFLNMFDNSTAERMQPILNHYPTIKNMGISVEEVAKLIESKKSAEIFDLAMQDRTLYLINDLADVKPYLKDLQKTDIAFVKSEVEPRLKQYSNLLELNAPDMLSEVIKNVTPETVNAIDITADFAKEYGSKVNYWGLLSAITKDNVKNLSKFLKEIKKTELWDSPMTCADDFKKYLNA